MAIPDNFHHLIKKLIAEKNPQSPEELQKVLQSMVGKSLFDLQPESKDMTAEEQARELVWEAAELPTEKGRRRAKKALKLDPNCIEAYEYLGNSYQYYDKAIPYYEKGIEIGRKVWGGDFLKQNKGHFWGITETRPFMRCLSMLAESYHGPGQTKKAIEIWQEMLELNPNDNQGIRYNLLPALLEVKDLNGYEKYRKNYDDDGSTQMIFCDALQLFMEEGNSTKAKIQLKKAKKQNKYVAAILTAEYPPEELPHSYTMGSKEEAIIYAKSSWRAWRWAAGARDWLKKS